MYLPHDHYYVSRERSRSQANLTYSYAELTSISIMIVTVRPMRNANCFFLTSISIAEFWTPLIGCYIRHQLFINTHVGRRARVFTMCWSGESSFISSNLTIFFYQITLFLIIFKHFFCLQSIVTISAVCGPRRSMNLIVGIIGCHGLYAIHSHTRPCATSRAYNSSTNIVRRLMSNTWFSPDRLDKESIARATCKVWAYLFVYSILLARRSVALFRWLIGQ
jgi:hypothetical protein